VTKYTLSRAVLIILFIIAIAIVLVITVKGSIKPYIPLPWGDEEARFIRALTCAYAMCIRKSCDSLIIDIGFLDKEEKISCYEKCKELETKPNCKEHKCGQDCSLEYKVNEDFTYNANYAVSVTEVIIPWIWPVTHNSMRNDVLLRNYWYYNVHYNSVDRGHCYWPSWQTVTLGGFTVNMGCQHDIGVRWSPVDVDGLCEGSLRSSNGCNKGTTHTGVSGEVSTVGTGHIWIDPAITSQCKEFNTVESKPTGTKYYGNCVFNKDQTIYIWTEPDKAILTDAYCPELILCSHS